MSPMNSPPIWTSTESFCWRSIKVMVSSRNRLRRYFSRRQISLRVKAGSPDASVNWDLRERGGEELLRSLFREIVIHILRGTRAAGFSDNARRDTRNRGVGWHRFQDDRAGTYAAVFADLDIAEHFGPDRKQHATANLRVAILVLFSGATKRDAVQHGNIIADNGRFADHHPGGVVYHDATAQICRRMNVHREEVRHPILDEEGHQPPAACPEKMRQAIAFERVKSLEEEKCLGIAVAGWIALIHRGEISTNGLTQAAVRSECFGKQFAHLHWRKVGAAKFPRQVIGNGVFQPFMFQDRRMREARELRFGDGQFFRLQPHCRPNRIATRKFFNCTHMMVPAFGLHDVRIFYH